MGHVYKTTCQNPGRSSATPGAKSIPVLTVSPFSLSLSLSLSRHSPIQLIDPFFVHLPFAPTGGCRAARGAVWAAVARAMNY